MCPLSPTLKTVEVILSSPGQDQVPNSLPLISLIPTFQKPQDQRLKLLSITLKETVCPVSEELPLDQCDFKRDGVSSLWEDEPEGTLKKGWNGE